MPQNILSTVMLENVKLSYGNVRLHLSTPEICQAIKSSINLVVQGGIQKFQYVSNCALASGAICLKILPFNCVSVCPVVLFFMTFGCREARISR